MDNQNNGNVVNNVTGVTPNIAPPVTPTAAPVNPAPQTPIAPPVTLVEAAPQQATTAAPSIAGPSIAGPDLQAASLTSLASVNSNDVNASTPTGPETTTNNGIIDVTTTGQSAQDIAAGIANGNFVNAVQDPNAMINGGKVGTTVSNEDEVIAKKAKNNIRKLLIFIIVAIILGGGGFYFYKVEFTTSGERIDALVNGINKYIVPIFRDCEKRIGTYDLNVDITQNTDKYGTHASGSYGYDLSNYIQLNGEVDSIVSKEELLGKDPVKYYFYINESKLYVKFEDLYEKFIYSEFKELDDLMNNIKQNDVQYDVLEQNIVDAIKIGLKSTGASQSVGSVNVFDTVKQANTTTINLNKGTLTAMKISAYESLINNPVFISNAASLTGNTDEDMKKKLTKAENEEVTYDGNINIRIYTGIFNKDFYGVDISTNENGKDYLITLIPIANGYRIIVKEDGNKNIDVNYTEVLAGDATKSEYTHTLKGDVYYKKNIYQIDSELKLVINIPYQTDKPVVKNSINIKYLSQEDFDQMFLSAKDKYNVIGSNIVKNKDKITKKIGYGVEDNTPTVSNETTTENTTN